MGRDADHLGGPTERPGALAPSQEDPELGYPSRARRPGLAGRTLSRRTILHLFRSRAQVDESLPAGRSDTQGKRRDALYRRSLAVADVAATATALGLAVIVLGGDAVKPALWLVLPLVVLAGKVIGLYDRDEHIVRKTTLDEAPGLLTVATLATLLIWLAEGALIREGLGAAEGDALGRDQVLGLWGLLFVGLLICRAVTRGVVSAITPAERCLVLGSAQAAGQVDRKFRSAHNLEATVVGRIPFERGEPANGDGLEVIGQLEQLETLVDRFDVDRVIIAPTTSDTEQLLDAIRLVKALGVKVSVLPRLFEVVGSSVRFDDVEGLMLLGVPQWGLSKSSAFVKRSMDIVGAAGGLIVLAPLLAAIALAVKITSRGPVFFRQPRIGRRGEIFQMTKFRTMCEGAEAQKNDLIELNEAEGLFKIANDPRLTRVGRVLRRFSCDELPQLFNVLRGDMSLVGPRPLVPDDDDRIEGWHRRRLDISPGMTGSWQVLGSSRIPLHEMVKIDYLYGATWSLWLDTKILLRTILYVLGRRGQ